MSEWFAKKIGDFVEDKIKDALGQEDEDDKKGGWSLKFWDSDGDHEKLKDWEEKDDEKGVFDRIFNRDCDDDDGKEKKSGFLGLFSEQEGASAAGGPEGGAVEGGGACGEVKGHTVAVTDGDLFDDLMDVAEETSKGK